MGRVTLLRTDFSASSDVSANQALLGAPASALLNEKPQSKTRTPGLGTIQYTFDAGVPSVWQGVFLGYHNGQDGTLRVTGDDVLGNLFTSPDYDSGTFPLRLPGVGNFFSWHSWHKATTLQTHRYVGLEIIDNGNTDGYFEAAIARIGVTVETDLEPELGASDGYEDTSIIRRLADGSSVARVKPQYDGRRYRWQYESEDSYIALKAIQQDYGHHTALVAKEEPENPAYERNFIIYGRPRWSAIGTFTTTAPYGYRSVDFSMNEI